MGVDTQRSVSTILGLLADNSNGQISEQDVRDGFVSWRNGHGQIYIAEADAATVTISDTSTFVEAATPAWTLSPSNHWYDESGGNGRLTYTGNVPLVVHIANTVSVTSASANQVLHIKLGLTGALDDASEAIMKLGTAGDVNSTALHLVTTMSTGDYLSLWIRNTTSSADVTIEVANLQIMTMPT